jgi:hypothetical protein
MRLRFSIAGLLGFVLLCGIGMAALHEATLLWASALFTLAVGLLCTAMLFAIVRHGRWRATGGGFAIFGWTYLLTTFWVWPAPNGVTAPPYLSEILIDSFPPSRLDAAVTWVDTGRPGEMPLDYSKIGPPSPARVVNRLHYRRIAHTLAAILCGYIGALVGRYSAAAESREDGG